MIVPHLEAVRANDANRVEWFDNCSIVDAIVYGDHYYVGFDIRFSQTEEELKRMEAAIIANDCIRYLLLTK